MIVTEEEAKTKWCQEARVLVGLPGSQLTSHNRDRNSGTIGHCIGSACMAWRWKRGSVYQPVLGDDSANFLEIEDRGPYSTTHGYCGKAGKP